MVQLIAGISIIIGLGFISLLLRDFIVDGINNDDTSNQEDAFCEIDMDHVLMYSDSSKSKDVTELKRKLQEFKNRNKFYKM
ncbi:hypothetical protein SAMN04488007_0679 [Maribacter aquivivus]|uniref:Uncharacterized protein n=1 Tax=Maribacter aquivivus TaxID=228958 RepID=A0A1M6K750_9FLAO|nr:hypothetical protein [Maribacter aquivivus]SHJ54764.1 hypothetical protein SAMN04488007_0679 [Maribacter aquivivus]